MTTSAKQPATALAAIVKEVSVPLSLEEAFALFTERTCDWWPLATHSVARESAASCDFEPRVGGRLVETARDGTQHVWGTVLAWEPPHRIAMTWHAGRSEDTAQHIEVTFSSVPDGATVLRLVHSGWERLGDDGPGQRARYVPGWDLVLVRYAELAATES